MAKIFACPSCQAPLELPDDNAPLVTCSYCTNSVIVPEDLREKPATEVGGFGQATAFTVGGDGNLQNMVRGVARIKQLIKQGDRASAIATYQESFGVDRMTAEQAVEQLATGQAVVFNQADFSAAMSEIGVDLNRMSQSRGGGRGASCLIIMLALLVILGVGAGAVFVLLPQEMGNMGLGESVVSPIVVSFGGEGNGNGLFEDARYIGLDGRGYVYVGEYDGGRIQVFEKDGTFVGQWFLPDDDIILRGMTVNPDGVLYVVYGGDLHVYDGLSGEYKEQIPYEDGFDDVYWSSDNRLLLSWSRFDDHIIRMRPSGEEELKIENAISSQTDENENLMRVAADGSGNIYVAAGSAETVFKFDREGKFVTRIGGPGREGGLFSAIGSIDVDRQGNVYVSDIDGIEVFDGNGRYLRTIDVGGVARQIRFTTDGEMWIITSEQEVQQWRLDE
ncbi:MAG TPA: hypothetical protein VLL52_22600 [Anaerolineae bacterium]|nr:hypothetical protein [Anaerolineae bacterium]